MSVGLPIVSVLLVAAAVLAGQLSVGWLNDYLDADRDRAVRRADKPVVTGALTIGAIAARRPGSRALFRAVLFTALLTVLRLLISFP